jgi:hypothetical protein
MTRLIKSRKSQMKMFETIIVLVVVFIMAIFALVYYNGQQQKDVQKMQEDAKKLQAMEIMKVANYLPELQCAKDNIETTNCVDIIKASAFSEISMENKLYYNNLFSKSNITLVELYPGSRSWTLYYNPPAKKASIQKNFVPILLYDPVSGRNSAGMIVIEVYG